jgi:hypothetical protein
VTTIANLVGISAPGSTPRNNRVPPIETTVYELHNVTLGYVRLAGEGDSDYHMAFYDPMGNSMIGEIPYPTTSPGCVNGASDSDLCLLTRARAALDTQYPGQISVNPIYPSDPVSVIGVGFWDEVHNPPQHGVAPNNIELHPVLAICFGVDCDPYAH